MRILALDLGTHTGWALFDSEALPEHRITSGTWHLIRAKGESKFFTDSRAHQLKECIGAFHPSPTYIFYEDVQFAKSRIQAQLWGGWRAIVSLFCPPSHLRPVPVGTLKKFATGNGFADKAKMSRHLVQRFIGTPLAQRILLMDDNEVDAYWLLLLAMKELCQ